MKINFLSFFERFIYKNTYIYHLIDYVLRHIYSYLTTGTSTNDIILLIDYYLRANSKLYTVHINTDSYFIS